MALEVTGKVHEIFEVQQVTDSFRKREFVLEMMDGQYTQHVKFQLTQDRCSLIDQFPVGSDVKISFNLTGRPYTNKEGKTIYFTNVNAWRIENQGAAGTDSMPPVESAAQSQTQSQDDMDDLPF